MNDEWSKFNAEYSEYAQEISSDAVVMKYWKKFAKNLLLKADEISEINNTDKIIQEKVIDVLDKWKEENNGQLKELYISLFNIKAHKICCKYLQNFINKNKMLK